MCVHRRVQALGEPILGNAPRNCKSFLAVQHDLKAHVRRGNPLVRGQEMC
jgi:hypothetical protein